jgi:hypothetical protein
MHLILIENSFRIFTDFPKASYNRVLIVFSLSCMGAVQSCSKVGWDLQAVFLKPPEEYTHHSKGVLGNL